MFNNCSINCHRDLEAIQNETSCFQLPIFQSENVSSYVIVFSCIVNILLLITAILGNVLVISVAWKTPSLRSPSNVLLCGLATTDLVVGLVVQPLYLYKELTLFLGNSETEYRCGFGEAFHIVSYTVCGVSLFTVTAISVDRFLALQYHLRYVNIVTVKRVMYFMTFNWLASGFLAALLLWTGNKVFLVVMAVTVGVCLTLSITVHVQIYRVVRRHQQQIQAQRIAIQAHLDNAFKVERFKRTALNAVLIHYFLLFCYTPLFITLLVTSSEDNIDSASWKKADSAIAWKLTSTIVFMNSAANPLIYCWRLREMRVAIKKTLKAIFCRL